MILGAIFGLTFIELLTTITLLGGIGGAIIWIRAKLVELEVKIKDLELRMETTETNYSKLDDKLDNKMEHILTKIENLVEMLNDIKLNCVKQSSKYNISENK